MITEATESHPVDDVILLSVVIIGRNEGERLRRCLSSVAGAVRRGFAMEAIYVDSGSVDGSLSLAESLGFRTISLHPERPTAALGRNAGWRATRGSFVMFLDGDTVLQPNFIADSLHLFSAPEVAVVWGHLRELYPEKSFYNRVLDLDWIHRPGKTAFCGGNALFRRSALVETNGFNEALIAGEEPELCRRIRDLGGTILHVDSVMAGHDLAITRFRQYWRRSRRTGHAYAEISERFAGTAQPLWSEESRRNRHRALAQFCFATLALLGVVVFKRVLPAALICCGFAALALRSAWKARWKTNNLTTLLFYGIHCHLQQVPMYLGQVQYKWNRRKQRGSLLIESRRS